MFEWLCKKEPTREERIKRALDDSLIESLEKVISSLTDDLILFVHQAVAKEDPKEKSNENSP